MKDLFAIHMNDGMRKTVVYNPASYLEDILLRICDARDAQIQDFDTSFMDGTPITKLNVSLAELGVTEIKFIEQGMSFPPLFPVKHFFCSNT